MYLQASANTRIVYFARRGDKPLNKESVNSLQREAHNGNAQMAYNEKYYVNIHLCF
jgi:cytidylate kinase